MNLDESETMHVIKSRPFFWAEGFRIWLKYYFLLKFQIGVSAGPNLDHNHDPHGSLRVLTDADSSLQQLQPQRVVTLQLQAWEPHAWTERSDALSDLAGHGLHRSEAHPLNLHVRHDGLDALPRHTQLRGGRLQV